MLSMYPASTKSSALWFLLTFFFFMDTSFPFQHVEPGVSRESGLSGPSVLWMLYSTQQEFLLQPSPPGLLGSGFQLPALLDTRTSLDCCILA